MKALVIYSGSRAPDYTNNLANIEKIEYEHLKEFPKNPPSANNIYEVVIAHHCLPMIEAGDVLKFATKMASLVRIGGELWLITPCFEWCAQQAEQDKPNPLIHVVLFGSKEEPHRSAYTLYWLRSIIEGIGMIPYAATQEVYTIHMGDKSAQLLQNHVIGHKIKEVKLADNPADALVIAHK
jgi:hypothetical protein